MKALHRALDRGINFFDTAAADLPPITPEAMAAFQQVYERFAKPHLHQRW